MSNAADNILFAFDLDGTVTQAEILPMIAQSSVFLDEVCNITRMTLDGTLDFETSFRLRFDLLHTIPLTEIHRIVAAIPLDPHIEAFIAENNEHCAIITGNLDCWIAPLMTRLRCAFHCSRSKIHAGKLALASLLHKGNVVETARQQGQYVIAIGDAANDIPMLLAADYGIAFSSVRQPARGLLAVAERTEPDALSLCRFLRQFKNKRHSGSRIS